MIRTVGTILLLTASISLGFGAAGGLKARVQDLKMLIHSLEIMERELEAHLTPLPQLLEMASNSTKKNVKEFYSLCKSGLDRQNGHSFCGIWSNAAEAAQLRILEQDLQLLVELGSVLGRYDAAGQCCALMETREKLTFALTEAEIQKNRLGNVYTTLGIASGAILSIVLW